MNGTVRSGGCAAPGAEGGRADGDGGGAGIGFGSGTLEGGVPAIGRRPAHPARRTAPRIEAIRHFEASSDIGSPNEGSRNRDAAFLAHFLSEAFVAREIEFHVRARFRLL